MMKRHFLMFWMSSSPLSQQNTKEVSKWGYWMWPFPNDNLYQSHHPRDKDYLWSTALMSYYKSPCLILKWRLCRQEEIVLKLKNVSEKIAKKILTTGGSSISVQRYYSSFCNELMNSRPDCQDNKWTRYPSECLWPEVKLCCYVSKTCWISLKLLL